MPAARRGLPAGRCGPQGLDGVRSASPPPVARRPFTGADGSLAPAPVAVFLGPRPVESRWDRCPRERGPGCGGPCPSGAARPDRPRTGSVFRRVADRGSERSVLRRKRDRGPARTAPACRAPLFRCAGARTLVRCAGTHGPDPAEPDMEETGVPRQGLPRGAASGVDAGPRSWGWCGAAPPAPGGRGAGSAGAGRGPAAARGWWVRPVGCGVVPRKSVQVSCRTGGGSWPPWWPAPTSSACPRGPWRPPRRSWGRSGCPRRRTAPRGRGS